MSPTKSDTVESSSSRNTKFPIERLNNFNLRLQALSQDLNDSLVRITCHHDANKAQFDLVIASVSNFKFNVWLIDSTSIFPRTTNSCNESKKEFAFKTFGET